ncbi:hypothetical protein [Tenacibaculum ovolyticum]|uniref:hypothetical protein n=1 Tax=Tenacibaculum ovolyticum TaxID=104270 RepID=UPI0007EDD031|nr:hypothetical protein [Tenacibaculum ovolyticum]
MKYTILMLVTLLIISCKGIKDQPATAEGFTAIENEIKNKFGKNAYYTDLNVSYDKSIGNMINLTVTEAPESLKMGTYIFSQHTSWKQNSEVTLEVPKGTKAVDFMYQLKDKINLRELGRLVEKSKKQLTEEKKLENPVLSIAFIKFPKNGDISKATYVVKLEPENGGTSFTYYYKLNGEFIKMDY